MKPMKYPLIICILSALLVAPVYAGNGGDGGHGGHSPGSAGNGGNGGNSGSGNGGHGGHGGMEVLAEEMGDTEVMLNENQSV